MKNTCIIQDYDLYLHQQNKTQVFMDEILKVARRAKSECLASLAKMQGELQRLQMQRMLTSFELFCLEQDKKGIKKNEEYLSIMEAAEKDYIYLLYAKGGSITIPYEVGDALFVKK